MMRKYLLAMVLVNTTYNAIADSQLEIPVLKLIEMNFNDVDPSNNPEIMMRQFEYTSSASPKELLAYYRASEHVQSCDYNDMADNYMCKLKKYGKVSSGYVFIPAKRGQDEVVILADYFYLK